MRRRMPACMHWGMWGSLAPSLHGSRLQMQLPVLLKKAFFNTLPAVGDCFGALCNCLGLLLSGAGDSGDISWLLGLLC